MKLAMAEVYEVATFYHHFDVVKEGGRGAAGADGARLRFAVVRAGRRADLLDRLPALLGPDVRVRAGALRRPLPHGAGGRRRPEPGRRMRRRHGRSAAVAPARSKPRIAPYVDYAAIAPPAATRLLRDCVAGTRDAEAVLDAMEHSGLRGLGGAGFPAGRKWRIVRAEPAPRLMAVNIDEGEPGTFKDRYYLERDPHRFLEGMLIAAWAVGIAEIYIYLRDEYAGCREILHARARGACRPIRRARCRAIHLRRGAGAYICGEESAMIESIEGKRGMPRLRPPYVAQVGLFGRPTLEHNMETLYWVRDIVEKGADWFAGHGRHGRKGLRSFSVSGRVEKPGVHLAPAGITVRELIDEYCGGMLPGHEFYAYLPGGASGGILPAALGDMPLDFDTLHPHGCFIGSAAVIVLSQHDQRARRGAAT